MEGIDGDRMRLAERLSAIGLKQLAKPLNDAAAPCLVARTSHATTDDPVGSRMGGDPHLPPDMDWPARNDGRPLSFIAQIDLVGLDADASLGLPKAGWLWFFYDEFGDDDGGGPWGFDPKDADAWRVLYRSGVEAAELQPRRSPVELPEGYGPTTSCTLTFHSTLSTVGLDDACCPELLDPSILSDETLDDYQLLRYELAGVQQGDGLHQLGGHPDLVQSDARLQCQLVSNGLYCGDATGYEDPRAALLEPGAKEWALLLQVDTDEDGPGWMWGDAGCLYFMIKRQDLEARNFSGVWLVLQCC